MQTKKRIEFYEETETEYNKKLIIIGDLDSKVGKKKEFKTSMGKGSKYDKTNKNGKSHNILCLRKETANKTNLCYGPGKTNTWTR